VALGFFALVAAACTQSGEIDYCRDHHLVHSEHLDNIGMITLDIDADGTLTKHLQLPANLGDGSDFVDFIALQLEGGARLRQIDVSILDQIPELEEIEVSMSTTATRKRFAINRQCESPIFRLD